VRALAVAAELGADHGGGAGVGEAADGEAVVERELPDAAVRDEAGAKALLAGYGVPVSAESAVPDRLAALQAAAELGYPVVLKGLCAGVQHKSDLGLVRTGIRDEAALQTAIDVVDDAVQRHGLDLDGYLIARQYDGIELIGGAVRDPALGPIVMVGAGGVLAEVLDDRVFLPCPATAEAVREAVGRLRIGRILEGHRGRSYDLPALAEAIAAASVVMAEHPTLGEMDLNPILVGPRGEGAVVVDALLARTDVN
jgi:hypothetical protein